MKATTLTPIIDYTTLKNQRISNVGMIDYYTFWISWNSFSEFFAGDAIEGENGDNVDSLVFNGKDS